MDLNRDLFLTIPMGHTLTTTNTGNTCTTARDGITIDLPNNTDKIIVAPHGFTQPCVDKFWLDNTAKEERELQQRQALNEYLRNMIKNVIFNKKVTIVFWRDGTKTIVKKQKGDKYNKEAGLAMAMAKKLYQNTNIFNDELRKWCN